MDNHYDIIIVGGGLVGNSLALALANCPIKVGIVEAVPAMRQVEFDYDARSIALSLGSKLFFDDLQLWDALKTNATAIKQVHVSDRGHFGFSRIHAEEMQVEALGYVVEMHALLAALMEQLKQYKNISRICPAHVSKIKKHTDGWCLDVTSAQQTQQLQAPLVVAADGGHSSLRKYLNITTQQYDYQQRAVVANVGLVDAHDNIAYERFTDTGPLALLPMTHQRSALVWTVPQDDAQRVLNYSDKDFLSQLQQRFGYRLGKFNKVGQRFSFPLKCVYAKEQVKPGFVLLGNSAHTLHPIAGQGFNLCLRDVMGLAGVLQDAVAAKETLGSMTTLQPYLQQRQQDQHKTVRYSDGLVKIFSNNFLPLSFVRNSGLVAVDIMQKAKQRIAMVSMGLDA